MSGPDIILQRALLAQSDISPSFLTQTQVHGDESGLFSHIGFGRCGHVFAIGGTCVVAKVAIDKDDLELWDDARMHQKIWESFQTHAGLNHVIQIPKSPNPMTVKDPTTQRGGQTTLSTSPPNQKPPPTEASSSPSASSQCLSWCAALSSISTAPSHSARQRKPIP